MRKLGRKTLVCIRKTLVFDTGQAPGRSQGAQRPLGFGRGRGPVVPMRPYLAKLLARPLGSVWATSFFLAGPKALGHLGLAPGEARIRPGRWPRGRRPGAEGSLAAGPVGPLRLRRMRFCAAKAAFAQQMLHFLRKCTHLRSKCCNYVVIARIAERMSEANELIRGRLRRPAMRSIAVIRRITREHT